MKKLIFVSFCIACVLVIASSAGLAQKPDSVVTLSNGFPSGPHFNLNIIAKDPANFVCPAPTFVDGVQVYGNVIYIPDTAVPGSVKVMIESGKKGPKSDPTSTELEVTDWCAGFGPDDTASLRIPANEAGYRAFARVLGKPTKDPDDPNKITLLQPQFFYVQDENGVDLLQLGLVTTNTIQTPEVFIRWTGKSLARNISPLFQYTGDVSYLSPGTGPLGTEPTYCCTPDANGVLQCVLFDPQLTTCAGSVYYVSSTVHYDAEWMFNIADFVAVLWGIDPSGAKLLQVRFYPEQNVVIEP